MTIIATRVLVLISLLALPAREAAGQEWDPNVMGTFSIIARDPNTGELERRHLCRRRQPCVRRGHDVAALTEPARRRLRPRLAHPCARLRRDRVRRRRATELQLRHAEVRAEWIRGALRPRLPDGHGVHQPRRPHERMGLCAAELLSRSHEVRVGATRVGILLHPRRARSPQRWATR